MNTYGQILEVSIAPMGDELAVDHALNATVLQLVDTADFNESGGQLQIGADVYTYVTIDDELSTVTLATGLLVAWTAYTRVLVYPLAEEKHAMVEVSQDDDVVLSRVPHALYDRLDTGVREEADRENVIVDPEDDYTIVDIIAKIPVVQGGYIEENTLPPSTPVPLPTVSPTPVIEAGPAAAIVRWEPVGVGLMVDVHVSLTGTNPPDATTLHTPDAGQPCYVYSLAPSNNSVPLSTVTDTYFALQVRNSADEVAPPSAWVVGQAGAIPEAFLTVLVGSLIAQRLTGETIEGTNIIGSTIDIENAFHAEPGLASFLGDAELLATIIRDNLTILGFSNYLQGKLSLGQGVTDPTIKPTVTGTWASNPTSLTASGASYYGLCDTPDGLSWVTVDGTSPGELIFSVITKATGAVTTTSVFADGVPRGITRVGNNYYVLVYYFTRTVNEYRIVRYNSSFTQTADWYVVGGQYVKNVPAIGNDGTNLIFCRTNSGNELRARIVSITNGTMISDNLLLSSWDTELCGVGIGTVDLGANRLWVQQRLGNMLVFNGATFARVSGEDRPRANNQTLQGIYWDGAKFQALASTKRVYDYTLHTGGSRDYAYTWLDSDAGGLGTAESLRSPIQTSSAAPRGSRPTMAVPAPPDDGTTDGANTVRAYIGPVGGTLVKQGDFTEGDWQRSFDPVLTTGNTVPSVSGFATRVSTSIGNIASDAGDANGSFTYIDGSGNVAMKKYRQRGVKDTGAFTAVDTAKTIAVTFPVSFDAPPIVVVGLRGVATPHNVYAPSASNITATGFNIVVSRRVGLTAFDVTWDAGPSS